MSQQQTLIASIAEKIDTLIGRNKSLQADYEALAAQCEKLRSENRELKTSTAQLEKRIELLELGGGFAGTATDKKRAAARINKLMREVNHCLALMNNR